MWAEEPETPEELLMRKREAETLAVAISALRPRLRKAIECALEDGEDGNYAAAAKRLGVSKTRARQLTIGAIGALRLGEHTPWVGWANRIERAPRRSFHHVSPAPPVQPESEPLPNALCKRCGSPFKSSNVGIKLRCDACADRRAARRSRVSQ